MIATPCRLLVILFFITATSTFAQVKFINPKPVGYSDAAVVEGGRTIYISGQVPVDGQGNVVGKGDLKAQTVQVFENLKRVLEAGGADFSAVVKINIYIVNARPEDVAVVRAVRRNYLSQTNPPASTLVGVTSLVDPNFLIEIEAIAVVKQ